MIKRHFIVCVLLLLVSIGCDRLAYGTPLHQMPTLNNYVMDMEFHNMHLIPSFTKIPTVTTTKSGAWNDPDVWSGGAVPGADAVVKVEQGHSIIYSGIYSTKLDSVGIAGTLTFDTYANSSLQVANLVVYPSGKLDVGTVIDPILGTVEIVILDKALSTAGLDPINGVNDPFGYGTGIIVLGEVNMHGREIASTWKRLAVAPLVGEVTLTLESTPDGWAVGDKVVIPDTRQFSLVRKWSSYPVVNATLNIEEATITAISGNTITLSHPLLYSHKSGKDTAGDVVGMPHLVNLTRNIVIRSENPNGVRGHSMFTERSKVDIRYVSFVGMGRTTANALDNTITTTGEVTHIGTNQVGRYPIHMHHHMGPENASNTGYQFTLIGNAVDDGAKWGITVHNSHFGLVDNNVVYNVQGAGIVTEMGNERENMFSNNFVLKTGVPITSWYDPIYGGVTGDNRPLKFDDFGWEGSAFWFVGNDNYLTGNATANNAFAGIMYNARPKGFWFNEPIVPNFRGADLEDLTQWTEYKNVFAPEIRLSANNEVYASSEGIWVSFAGIVGEIRDTLAWNISQVGIYSQRNESVTYRNVTLVNDQAISNQNYIGTINKGINLNNPSYPSGNNKFFGIKVEGYNLGVDLPIFLANTTLSGAVPLQETTIDDAYLRNYVNVRDTSPRNSFKTTLLKDIEFITNSGPSNSFLATKPFNIVGVLEAPFRLSEILLPSTLTVLNYNKIPGNDFEYFFPEQSPSYVMPKREWPAGTVLTTQNCPTDGMTNSQCWIAHQKATLNRVATCDDTTTRPSVKGFTCPIQ